MPGVITAGRGKRPLPKAARSGSLKICEGGAVEASTVKPIKQNRLALSSPAGNATLTFGQIATDAPAKP